MKGDAENNSAIIVRHSDFHRWIGVETADGPGVCLGMLASRIIARQIDAGRVPIFLPAHDVEKVARHSTPPKKRNANGLERVPRPHWPSN